MNPALWFATFEYLLSSPLAYDGEPCSRRPDLAWLRDWFCDYVRGGAALPTLRIGTQPYGLLPVTSMPFGAAFWTPSTNRDWLEHTSPISTRPGLACVRPGALARAGRRSAGDGGR